MHGRSRLSCGLRRLTSTVPDRSTPLRRRFAEPLLVHQRPQATYDLAGLTPGIAATDLGRSQTELNRLNLGFAYLIHDSGGVRPTAQRLASARASTSRGMAR